MSKKSAGYSGTPLAKKLGIAEGTRLAVRRAPEDYVRQLSATTGLPHVLVRRNMEKIRGVLDGIEHVLAGLTRDLDLSVLDRGIGSSGGHAVSFTPRSQALGVVLPSNSPGVHSLWAPAVALKTALVLKPGSAEPWTPFRMIQAFLAAGAPPEAFGFYPTDHEGSAAMCTFNNRGRLERSNSPSFVSCAR